MGEKQKSDSCIENVMGYVSHLEDAIKEDDYLYMRLHRSPERYKESFVRCRRNVEKYIGANVTVDLEHAKFEQMSLFEM